MPKGKYQEWLTEDGLLKIEGWARSGLTNKQIASNMGITEETFYKWIKQYSEFSESLKKGKAPIQYEIENALIKKAKGYTECSEIVEEVWMEDGEIKQKHKKQIMKNYPPDTASAIFILKNRLKNVYQDHPKADEELESIRLENELKRIELERLGETGNPELGTFAGIPADLITPTFLPMHHDIARQGHREYLLPGGRGSTKSTIISLELINLIEKNPNLHAVVTRSIAERLRTTVYNQVVWAINKLGLRSEYKYNASPLEITKLSTGQKIYFRSAKEPEDLKSIKPEFGYVGILWFEELNQFPGPESVRQTENSVIRGGEQAYIFKSYNPPKSALNWVNEYRNEPDDNKLVIESNYKDVPVEWLGQPFIDRAEHLKEINPKAYENEYLGKVTGTGANVFENLESRDITDEEIRTYDRIVYGLDFGWQDPLAFIKLGYNSAKQELIFIDEFSGSHIPLEVAVEEIKKKLDEPSDMIVGDSGDLRSLFDCINLGLNAVGAKKGPGSIKHGIRWMQSRVKLIIDPKRTPAAFKEFSRYEYLRDREENILEAYPDKDNHLIDASRYATEQFSMLDRDWNKD